MGAKCCGPEHIHSEELRRSNMSLEYSYKENNEEVEQATLKIQAVARGV